MKRNYIRNVILMAFAFSTSIVTATDLTNKLEALK